MVGKSGSEREFVIHPVLLGFPAFCAGGLTGLPALEGSRRQCSPASRPVLALIVAAVGIRPFSSPPTTRPRSDTPGSASARAAAHRADSMGFVRCWQTLSGEAKPQLRYCKRKGCIWRNPPYTAPLPVVMASEPALLSRGTCVRSTVHSRDPEAMHPRKGETPKSPPIGGFYEFSRRAENRLRLPGHV